MLILLSPSKTMSAQPELPSTLTALLRRGALSTQPAALRGVSEAIIKALSAEVGSNEALAIEPLRALMGVSDRLAREVHQALMSWHTSGAQPAILSYTGDVFKGLSPADWSDGEWLSAQARLRVLSGLYGSLKPLDLICPYRLEMGFSCQAPLAAALSVALGATQSQPTSKAQLAQLWRPLLTQHLGELAGGWTLNLSSQEYSQALDFKALKLSVCAPRFLDLGPKGDYKIVSRYAKRARGLMARYALSVGASSPQDLTGFNLEGYELSETESRPEDGALTFKRDTPISP